MKTSYYGHLMSTLWFVVFCIFVKNVSHGWAGIVDLAFAIGALFAGWKWERLAVRAEKLEAEE